MTSGYNVHAQQDSLIVSFACNLRLVSNDYKNLTDHKRNVDVENMARDQM